jgi:protein TonB
MGYQALLFCPDEKLARVVTQVFTELDFHVESVNEPFAAVKKLMAQRYDAVVVDCENEQNATLLFKSARNSSSNQSSLALALVEGQAGVAKAYRIGANLVLTKPINVEQAKGTLRVARGLLRKNADSAAPNAGNAARPAITPKTTVAPVVGTSKPRSPIAEPAVKPGNAFESLEFNSALPAMAASAESHEIPATDSAPWSKIPVDAEPTIQLQHQSATPEPLKPVAAAPSVSASTSATPVKKPVSPTAISQGAAAAPAPAKEAPASSETRKAESALFEAREASVSTIHSTEATTAPVFAALGDSQETDGSGGSKKILAIAAVVIIAAGLGYVGWTKLGKNSPASTQPVPASRVSVQAPAPTTSSSSLPTSATSQVATPTTQQATTPASLTPPAGKPSAGASSSPATRIAVANEPAVSKSEPAPLRVKTQPKATRAQAAEEAAPQIPNPLGVASASDKTLSGLVASTPVSIPRPAPGKLKISQGVSQGLLINRVQPKYPSNALAMRIQGAVQIEATINKEGKITNLKPISGDPVLARAAMDAVRQWRYKPYFLDGEPVEIQTQIAVNFKLPN